MTLSVEKREVALRLRKQGMSNAKVAAALGVDHSTIIRLLERVRDTGDITPKSSSGRPRMFAPRDEGTGEDCEERPDRPPVQPQNCPPQLQFTRPDDPDYPEYPSPGRSECMQNEKEAEADEGAEGGEA